MSLSANFPTSKPTLNLDFANVGALDPRITFSRTSSATYTNSLGLIATAAAGVARFDYDPTTLAARGLLIEEQRTNLLTYSEQFGSWIPTGGSSVSSNTSVSPDGQVTADTYTISGAGDYLYNSASVSASTTYTMSIFIKAGTKSSIRLFYTTGGFSAYVSVDVNPSAGTIGTTQAAGGATAAAATIQPFGTGWYRVSLTGNLGATTTGYVVIGNDSGTGTVLVWGAQLEAGSFATSYIPTLASTVTRSADVASVNTLSPWYNASAGTFLFDFNQLDITAIGTIGDDTFNNSLRFNVVNMARASGSGFANFVTLGTSQNGSRKLAVAMKVDDYAGVFDGGVVSTDTSASMVPSPTVFGIGRDYGSSAFMNGWMRRIAYYPRRLLDAELQALTA